MNEILQKIKKLRIDNEEEVIYGVYNNADKGVFVRLNDFFVDHTKITIKDKSYFFHMLAMMVGSGIPVVRAVKSLARHTENPRFRRVLATIAYNCDHGLALADAMTRFEDVFEESEIGIVRAGEASGQLNGMLIKLAAQLENRHDLSMKLWGAAVYPIAVLGVLLIVTIGMLVFVLPNLLSLLQEGGVADSQLPFATLMLITVQKAVVGYWWLILLVVFGIYGAFVMYKGTYYGQVNWDYAKLRIPLVGALLRKVYVLRFVGMLGLLIDAGLPVLKALSVSGEAQSNHIYKMKIAESGEQVKKGLKISGSLEDSEFLFPSEVVQMLRVGEESANLGAVSEKISIQYQKEVDNTLKKVTSVFEPLMILFVGLFVALLAMAIMAPIFNLSTIVGN
ncbi:MAG: type II secretion system F family protein [Candidatus Gracilibacteria bacterium]